MKKITLESAKQEFINRNLTPLFNEYNNTHEKLLAQTQEGYLVQINLNRLKKDIMPEIFYKNNPYIIQNIKLWIKINQKPFELLDRQEYKDSQKKLQWKCLKDDCGEIFEASWNSIQSGNGCGFCRGLQVGLFNCLTTKRPDLVKYLKYKEDGYKYTEKSSFEIVLKCPKCGYIKNRKVKYLSIDGFSCPKCGDGFSYPEKFLFSLLEQLYLDFKPQLTKNILEWCVNFRYDFYIINLNCIIETHGIQHYKDSSGFYLKTLEEEQVNDKIKMQLALDNNIKNYIIIDCRKSDLEWIKNSIMQSELPQLLNFKEEDIDWLKCHEWACGSLVKVVCDYWNRGIKNTQSIAGKLNINRATIVKYLKIGKELNWCDYNAKEESIKSLNLVYKNNSKKVILLNTGEIFNSIVEASKNCNVNKNSIISCCKSKLKSAGKLNNEKMIWKYYKDYLELNKHII